MKYNIFFILVFFVFTSHFVFAGSPEEIFLSHTQNQLAREIEALNRSLRTANAAEARAINAQLMKLLKLSNAVVSNLANLNADQFALGPATQAELEAQIAENQEAQKKAYEFARKLQELQAKKIAESAPKQTAKLTVVEPTPAPNLEKLSQAAKATPGKPVTQILQSGGKIIGKVVVLYVAGKFVYDFYSYDGNAFQKTINAANNITYIPFTPDFSGITKFVLKGPEYLKQKALADLVQKMTALNDCLNRWEVMKDKNIIVQCAPSSFLGTDTTQYIRNEKDAAMVRDDLQYYQDLYMKRMDEKK
jgi:hypothetical protein